MLHPVGQLGLLLGQHHDLAVDPGRLAASVDLRHPPHAHQRVAAGAEHQLLQIPDLLQVPCLRRREDPLPQPPYVVLDRSASRSASQSTSSSSGPFTVTPLSRPWSLQHGRGVQLALRFRRLRSSCLRRLTRPASAPFQVRASRPYPASYAETAGGGASIVLPVSCCLSATGIRFSGRPAPAGDSAFLTVGLPGTDLRLDPIGVVTFRMRQIRPGWVPSVPRGRWCAPARPNPSGRHLPPSSGQSLSPAGTSHRRECS